MHVETIPAAELVPGDVFLVQSGSVMHCDAALLSGSCIVSESMLTGESTPVIKATLPVDPAVIATLNVASDADARVILFSGTKVLQAKSATAPPPGVPQLARGTEPTCIWQL